MILPKGWLIEGLRDAKREADARPELRERVASHPSGFLNEIQTETQTEVVPHTTGLLFQTWLGI